MTTAKIFENGSGQAVRLPKEYRFSGDEVLVDKIGDIVLLMPKNNQWAGLLSSLNLFTPDFMQNGRAEEFLQGRESL